MTHNDDPGLPFGYIPLVSCLFPFSPEMKSARGLPVRGYMDETDMQAFVDQIEGHTLVTYDGLMSLANQVRHCELHNLSGDYVDIGTYKGGTFALMALCNLRYGSQRRRIHAFDSFEGLPQPIAADIDPLFTAIYKLDDARANGSLESTGQVAAGPEFLSTVLASIGYPEENVFIHKGWFQDTVPVASQQIDKIAILRLDGDLYESYRVPLAQFYDKVVPGGFVVIDDWIFQGCRKAVTDFFATRGGLPYMDVIDMTVRVIRKL